MGMFGKSLVSLLLFVLAEAAVAVVLLDIVPMVMRNGNYPKAKRSESEMNTQSGRRRGTFGVEERLEENATETLGDFSYVYIPRVLLV